jgi:hypothetical protein
MINSLPARFSRAVVLILATSLASRAGAQSTLMTLNPGDTLRVWAVAPSLNGVQGVLSRFRSDTLTLADLHQVAGQSAVRATVPYAALRRVDVRRGTYRSPGRIVLGVIAGAAGGILLGGYIGVYACEEWCNSGGDLDGLLGLMAGASIGAVAGGVTGGVIAGRHRSPRWVSVTLTR